MSPFASRFVVHDGSLPLPDDLQCISLTGGFVLSHDGDDDVVEVHASGSRVGWLFGTVVDIVGQTVERNLLELEASADPNSVWDAVAKRCSGSWFFIADLGNDIEFRLDACGTIGLVYDKERRCAASYAYLLLGDQYQDRLQKSAIANNRLEGDGWMTAGQTAHQGIYRLMPNHALHSGSFEPHRFELEPPSVNVSDEELVDQIAQEVRQCMEALHASEPIMLTLTGGKDSRGILACVRAMAHNLRFVTMNFPSAVLDVHLAKKLASYFDLDLTVIEPIAANAEEVEQWAFGAGHSLAGTNKRYFPTIRQLPGVVLIGGGGGEVARGFLWTSELVPDQKIETSELLVRLKLPQNAHNIEAVDRWLSELPQNLTVYQVLDLAYIELRMATWAYAQPVMRETRRRLSPLISFNQFQRFSSLSHELRQRDGVMELLIKRQWPELLKVPTNRYGDYRDKVAILKKALLNPGKVIRKVRKMALAVSKAS